MLASSAGTCHRAARCADPVAMMTAVLDDMEIRHRSDADKMYDRAGRNIA
jgi:hypothetical protein